MASQFDVSVAGSDNCKYIVNCPTRLYLYCLLGNGDTSVLIIIISHPRSQRNIHIVVQQSLARLIVMTLILFHNLTTLRMKIGGGDQLCDILDHRYPEPCVIRHSDFPLLATAASERRRGDNSWMGE